MPLSMEEKFRVQGEYIHGGGNSCLLVRGVHSEPSCDLRLPFPPSGFLSPRSLLKACCAPVAWRTSSWPGSWCTVGPAQQMLRLVWPRRGGCSTGWALRRACTWFWAPAGSTSTPPPASWTAAWTWPGGHCCREKQWLWVASHFLLTIRLSLELCWGLALTPTCWERFTSDCCAPVPCAEQPFRLLTWLRGRAQQPQPSSWLFCEPTHCDTGKKVWQDVNVHSQLCKLVLIFSICSWFEISFIVFRKLKGFTKHWSRKNISPWQILKTSRKFLVLVCFLQWWNTWGETLNQKVSLSSQFWRLLLVVVRLSVSN